MRLPYISCLLTAAAAVVAACGSEQLASALPATDEEFEATLVGSNEVPPNASVSTGTARFAIVLDTFIVFRIDVGALDSATGARIHKGAAGVRDSAIVTLFSGVACRNAQNQPINTTSPSCRIGYAGQLSEGQFKPALLTGLDTSYGATARERYDSLITLMRTGNAYVEVRTKLRPTGEIRGQIQPAP